MAQADGTIIIDTEIGTERVKAGTRKIEKAVKNLAKQTNDLGSEVKAQVAKQVAAVSKLNIEYAAQSRKVKELRAAVKAFKNEEIPTAEYREIQAEIDRATQRMNKLIAAQEKYMTMGGEKNSKRYKSYQYDIDELKNSLREATKEMQQLKAEGQAFTVGNKTEEAKMAMDKLRIAEAQLKAMAPALQSSYDRLKASVSEYAGQTGTATQYVGVLQSALNGLKLAAHAPISVFKALGATLKSLPLKISQFAFEAFRKTVEKVSAAVKKLLTSLMRLTSNAISTGLKKISTGILGIHKNANKSTMSLGRMLGSSLLFSAVFMGISGVLRGVKEGLQNLAQYSGATNSNISMLVSSLETLKNSFASAFAPILNVVAPILSGFINMLSRAITYVGMFIAALTGQKTYTKALPVQKDYAASLQDTATGAQEAADSTKEAAEAAEDYLSPLDDINRYTEKNESSSGAGGSSPGAAGGAGTEGPLFEETPILSSIKGIADKIKNLIKSEDFEGLGAYIADGINRGLAKIKNAISWDNIGPEITYFVNAFTKTFNSLVDHLDWDLLGRTIGEGINTIVNTLNLLITGINWKNLGAKIAEGVNGLADEVNFWNLGTLIGNKIMILPQMILGFAERLNWSLVGKQIAEGLNGMVSALNLSVVAEALGKAINGFFEAAIEFARAFDWSKLGTNIYQGINTFISTVDWAAVGKGLSDFVKGVLDTLISIIQGIDWAEVVEAIETTLANIDWLGIAGKILEFLASAISTIIGSLAKIIGDAIGSGVEGAIEYFREKTEECGGNVVNGIFKGIGDAVKGIAGWIYEHIFKPFIEGFQNAFGIHSPSTVMAEQGRFIIEGLLQGITDLMNKIKVKFNEIKDLIVGKISEAKDGAIQKASDMKNKFAQIIDDIREKFRRGFANLVDLIKSPVNGVIRMLNSLLDKVESAQNWIAEALSFNIKLPGWAQELTGYSSFGVSVPRWIIPNIPYLASGAVIPPNKEFMAVLGDQNQGNNIEAPEGLIRRIVREEAGRSSGNKYEVALKVGRRELAKLVIDEAKLIQMQTGRNPFELA